MPEENIESTESETESTESTTEPTTTAQDGKDWKAEAEKWQKLSRENEARAKANVSAVKRLAALEESQKTETQKIQDRAAAAEAAAAQAQKDLVRYRVAAAKSLPPELVERLRGDTEEEMLADADSLLKLIKPKAELRPDPSQGARGTGSGSPDMNALLRTAAGRG
jgi:hypothetical protein